MAANPEFDPSSEPTPGNVMQHAKWAIEQNNWGRVSELMPMIFAHPKTPQKSWRSMIAELTQHKRFDLLSQAIILQPFLLSFIFQGRSDELNYALLKAHPSGLHDEIIVRHFFETDDDLEWDILEKFLDPEILISDDYILELLIKRGFDHIDDNDDIFSWSYGNDPEEIAQNQTLANTYFSDVLELCRQAKSVKICEKMIEVLKRYNREEAEPIYKDIQFILAQINRDDLQAHADQERENVTGAASYRQSKKKIF